MDVHLDLNMTMIRPLDGLQQSNGRFTNLCVFWKHSLCLHVCRYDMNPCGIS